MSIILKRKFTPGDGWQYVGEEEAGGGGGGSLPDWWTVDSTPGAESFTLEHDGLDWDDTILINTPDPGGLNGFYYVYRVHNVDTDVDAVVIDADGHMNLEGPAAQFQVRNPDTGFDFIASTRTNNQRIAWGNWKLDSDYVQKIPVGVAPDDGNIGPSTVYVWYDDTNGAAKLKLRGAQADGTLVSGEIALT